MYEQHFSLTKLPFRANARGNDVFVGPQIVAAMAGIRRTLNTADAIAAVSGPVGSGKTTLVLKVLEANESDAKVVHIGRIRLQSEDVLELLLNELGVDPLPAGPIRSYAAFRRALAELEDSGSRLIIVVEDYSRLDTQALAELEALTAADAGPSHGAAIILMGDDGLLQHLSHPDLIRTQQRTRQHFMTAAMNAAEVRGYLRHCFREAGRNFEDLFDANATDLLAHLSGGAARVINNLVEAALAMGAEQQLERIPSSLIAKVATDEFGLDVSGFQLSHARKDDRSDAMATMVAADLEAPPSEEAALQEQESEQDGIEYDEVSEDVAETEVDAEIESVAEFDADVEPEVESRTEVESELAAEAEYETEIEPEAEAEAEIDFEAELDAEAEVVVEAEIEPDLAAESEADVDMEIAVESDTDALVDDLPVLEASPEVSAEQEPEAVVEDETEFTQDPTINELLPDIEELEAALALQGEASAAASAAAPQAEAETPAVDIPELIPEITLDTAINGETAGNGETFAAAPATKPADIPATNDQSIAINIPDKNRDKADVEIDNIASVLASAKSIDDIDAKMAETLFGEELSIAASQMLPPPAAGKAVSRDEARKEREASKQQDEENASSNDRMSVTLESSPQRFATSNNQTATQRLKTVRALNAGNASRPTTPESHDVASQNVDNPESVEEQIDVSMSQTFEALNLRRPPAESAANESETEEKRGFFGRFKRT